MGSDIMKEIIAAASDRENMVSTYPPHMKLISCTEGGGWGRAWNILTFPFHFISTHTINIMQGGGESGVRLGKLWF